MDMCETKVKVLGGETTTWILFGEESSTPLLGALTLESLLLGIDPFDQRLVPVDGILMAGLHQV